jgi:RNA 2',3'-cyclic 3'-phosphodiesterase
MSFFVAVRLPAVATSDLAVAQSALPPQLTAMHPDLRWVPPQNWHLTVTFLGNVPEQRRADLTARLARAAARHPWLSLRLSGAGHFGPRVLFVGVTGDVAPLRGLAASVSAAARRAKVPVDDRPYRPHLTLARVRGTASLRDLAAALASYDGPTWSADAIDLMESRPSAAPGHPPSYVSQARFVLGRPVDRP